LKWGTSSHTAIVESVWSATSGNVTTYTITISQYNAAGRNEYSTFTTYFKVTRQANGNRIVTDLPRFRTGGTGATGFYR